MNDGTQFLLFYKGAAVVKMMTARVTEICSPRSNPIETTSNVMDIISTKPKQNIDVQVLGVKTFPP